MASMICLFVLLQRQKVPFHVIFSFLNLIYYRYNFSDTRNRHGHIYPEPNRKHRLCLGLDPTKYLSGSYISRTKEPEPNLNRTELEPN